MPILTVICVMCGYWYATSEDEKTLVSTTSNDTSGIINITGDWDITVFNSDGTIAESLEFQNHFIGERLLTDLLVGDMKAESPTATHIVIEEKILINDEMDEGSNIFINEPVNIADIPLIIILPIPTPIPTKR